MGNRSILSRILGMIGPDFDVLPEETPAPQPVRLIPGGPAASELCMLAVEWDGLDAAAEAERASRQRDVRLAQVKVDGINAVFVDGMIVGGRDGAPLDCALQCQPGLGRLEQALGEEMVFFGEYCAHDGFDATLSEHRRRKGDGAFWLYDAVPFATWQSGRPYGVPIEQRLERLRSAFHSADTGLFVGMLDFWLLDAGEMRAKAHEVWAAGFEGLVSKRLGSPYIRGRSKDWRKVKQRHRANCEVIDTMHRNGKLRSIIVRGPVVACRDGEAVPSKPVTITGGWTPEEAGAIDIGMADGSAGRVVAIEFELTVGTPRSIRAPKFAGLVA